MAHTAGTPLHCTGQGARRCGERDSWRSSLLRPRNRDLACARSPGLPASERGDFEQALHAQGVLVQAMVKPLHHDSEKHYVKIVLLFQRVSLAE